MLYILIFAALAVVLVVAGLTVRSRNAADLRVQDARHRTAGEKQQRKGKRAQSRNARRKRH